MRILTLVLFLFVLNANLFAHPFYVSILEVNVNNKSKTLECALKIFTDDLESTLQAMYNSVPLHISTQNETNYTDSLLIAYLKTHVVIQQQKKLEFKYIGREGDLDAQWIYFEFPLNNTKSNFEITWSSLIDFFPSQKNILYFELNGARKTHIFDSNTKSATFKLIQ